jgi:heat shock protein HslJ/uncharacterized lipoprotein YbaY
MNIEDQENSGIPVDEDKPDMAPEGAPGSPIPASDDFEPVQESVTPEIDPAAGEADEPVPPVDLPAPAEDEPEEEDKPNWMPWAVVAVIVLAVIIVIALAAGGRLGGGAESTPTPTAPEVIQPYIQIDQPIQGATLDLSSPIMVSGIGRGLFEGNVMLQARDAGGNVLAEQPTSIQSPDAGTGGEGPWSAQLSVQVPPGTTGQIVAFSTSPVDGSTTAATQVAVTYGQAVQPYIQIDQPIQGTILDISSSVLVSGIGRGLFEGNVVVQARDAGGNVLAEQPTTIHSPDAGTGGEGPWAVQLSVQTQSGTTGQIVAFSTSPADGSIIASAQVAVTYGQAVQAYIQMDQPAEGSLLDIANPVQVGGTGGGLFEGNVVVQARDSADNVLAEQPTVIQSPDAGTGGEGPWSVQLSIPAEPGTTGQIVAFSPSPVDGTLMASAQVNVTYGQVQEPEVRVNLEDHLWLLASLAGQELISGIQVYAEFDAGQVTGSAGCNNYNAGYESSGNSLTIGAAGVTRKACSEPQGVMEQENQYLSLLGSATTYAIEAGQLKVSDGSGQVVLVYNAAVIGTLNTVLPTEIPIDSIATITLGDVSRADAPAIVIGQQVITGPTAFPFPFEVVYNPEDIDPRFTYAIGVRITDGAENLLFTNTSAYNVITRDNPSRVEVIVEPVQ